MNISLHAILIRYLREKESKWTRDDHILFTAGAFLCDDDEFVDLQLRQGNKSIDCHTVDLILQSASSIEIGVILRHFGIHLSADLFLTHAMRAVEQTNDVLVLTMLGAAIYDYLRLNGKVFDVDPGIAKKLVLANDSYARIVGIRLMALQPAVDAAYLGSLLLRALKRPTIEERSAALNLIHDVQFYDFPQRIDLRTAAAWTDISLELEALIAQRETHLSEIAARILSRPAQ